MPDPDQLAKVLAKDSQAGTAGAQDREEPVCHLSDAELAKLEQIIHELDPGLTANSINRSNQ